MRQKEFLLWNFVSWQHWSRNILTITGGITNQFNIHINVPNRSKVPFHLASPNWEMRISSFTCRTMFTLSWISRGARLELCFWLLYIPYGLLYLVRSWQRCRSMLHSCPGLFTTSLAEHSMWAWHLVCQEEWSAAQGTLLSPLLFTLWTSVMAQSPVFSRGFLMTLP